MRLVLDVHLSAAVAQQLRRRKMDIATVQGWIGADRTPDEAILRKAHREGRVFVTYDCRTVPGKLRTMAAAGEPHAGVVLIDDRTILQDDIGGLVRALLRLERERGQEDWTNLVIYLPPA